MLRQNEGGAQGSPSPAVMVDSDGKEEDERQDTKDQKNEQAPCFSDEGMCLKCKSTNQRDESINCCICNKSFHAVCRDNKAVLKNDAIVTATNFAIVRPMIAKYGACKKRWGNFLFVCEECMPHAHMKKISTSDSECQTDSDKNTLLTSDIECQTDKSEETASENVEPVENEHGDLKLSTNTEKDFIKQMGCLLRDMKSEILDDVKTLISSKLDVMTIPAKDVIQTTPDNGKSPLLYSDIAASAPSFRATRHSTPSSESFTSGYSSDSVASHAKKEKVVVLSTDSEDCEVDQIADEIDKQFENIPFTLLKKNKKNKNIVLEFPSERDAQAGKDILGSCQLMNDKNYTISDAKLMLPKITVSNIPNYLVAHIVAEKNKLSPNAYREKLKEYLLQKILEKNTDVKTLKNDGKTFEIVYVNVGDSCTTLGVKVSPIIRESLLFNKGVYVGHTKCLVYDRFYIKQCFKCQKIGHHASVCREPTMICMYCSGSHQTGACPSKQDKSQFRCRNCAQSSDPAVRFLCNSHHSGSKECPTITKERSRLQERTNYSKN